MRAANGYSQICYYLLLAVIFIGATYGSYDDDDDDETDAAAPEPMDKDGVTAADGKNHHRNYREPYGE